MVFSKKMLGSCCVGLALLLSGESFGMQSVGDIDVNYQSKTKKLSGAAITSAYNTLVEVESFREMNVGNQALAVTALALIDGGFSEQALEGYKGDNKAGIVGLVGTGELSKFFAYYDAEYQLVDKIEGMIKSVVAKPAVTFGQKKDPKASGGMSLFSTFGKKPSEPTPTTSTSSSAAKPTGLFTAFGRANASSGTSPSASSVNPPRSRTPSTNYNLGQEDFEESAKERLGSMLPKGWDKKAALNGTVDAGVVEILFGGNKFLTTVSALEAAQRHFVVEGVKPDAKAFVRLVQSFIKQDGELAEAKAALEKERADNAGAIKGDDANQAQQYAAYFNELNTNGAVIECHLGGDEQTPSSMAAFSIMIPDVNGAGLEFGQFVVSKTGKITNPIAADKLGVYNIDKFELHRKGEVAVTQADAVQLATLKDGNHEMIDTSTHTKVLNADAAQLATLKDGNHELVETAHKNAELERKEMLAKVASLKESSTVVTGINSGAAVFGATLGARDNAVAQVDALLTEINKFTDVFGAIDTAELKAADITVLNTIARKLLTGDWSNINDDTNAVEDENLKRVLNTAKTLVANNVDNTAVQYLVAARFGSFGATDENSVRRALLIAVLAGKNADAIKGSIAN